MEKQKLVVAPGITCFQEPLGVRFVSFYALDDGDTITLFDAGIPSTVTHWIDNGTLSKPITRLIISHSDADHFGDTANLKARFPEMEIMCHAADRYWTENHDAIVAERYGFSHARYGYGYPQETLDALRSVCGDDFTISQPLAEGATLNIGGRTWEVLHIPGHSPGHIGLWSAADSVLLLSDAVLGFGPPNSETGKPSMPSTHQDIAPYLATIDRLSQLPVKLALAAHWHPMDGEAFAAFLSRSRQRVEQDLALVRDACQQHPLPFAELMQRINDAYREWDSGEDINYIFALDGAIQHLLATGDIHEKDGRFYA